MFENRAYTKYKDNERSRISDHVMDVKRGNDWGEAWNLCDNEKAPAAAVTPAMKAK